VCNTIEEVTEAVENWHEGRDIADGYIVERPVRKKRISVT
jgi:hypothetical protein